ncbi:MAG: SEC-C domain-containing protein [Acidobacteria bacterium]|nr:SEC-C domain-containing protein [Acidobacteriota bacterium]
MASDAQTTANQANALLSTGPRTEAGRAASSRNAVRHGFNSSTPVVAEDELAEFEELRSSWLRRVRPVTNFQLDTVDRLVHHAWTLRRIERLQREALAAGNPFLDPESARTFDRLHRYQRDHERAYYRAFEELQKAAEVIAADSAPPDPGPAAEQPAGTNPISRSAPCPCGSGLKFKRCCGQNAPGLFHPAG